MISQFYPSYSTEYLNPFYKIFFYYENYSKILKFEGNENEIYSIRFQFINASKLNFTQNNSNFQFELNKEIILFLLIKLWEIHIIQILLKFHLCF